MDVDGWLLAEGDTRERSTAAQFHGDTRNTTAGDWSGLEIWRLDDGSFLAFQVRMRQGRPKTYTLTGETLRQLFTVIVADFWQNYRGSIPRYWGEVMTAAVYANAALIEEATNV